MYHSHTSWMVKR